LEPKKHEILQQTLISVNDWLKFAEAKNGAYIAVACSILFGLYSITSKNDDLDISLIIYIACFSVLISTSIVIAIASFIPRLTPPFWIKMDKKEEKDNPIFFGHACKYSKKTYLQLLDKKYGFTEGEVSAFEIDLVDQIINNSKIAFIKYRMFNSAVWLFISALLTPIGAAIYWKVKE